MVAQAGPRIVTANEDPESQLPKLRYLSVFQGFGGVWVKKSDSSNEESRTQNTPRRLQGARSLKPRKLNSEVFM